MVNFPIPNGWKPRAYQMPLWQYLEWGGKRAVECWHRRAGKDDVALHWTAVSAMRVPGNYWHMLPEYSHGRRALWEAVNSHSGKRRIDEAFPPEIRNGKPNETGMRIEFSSGSIWHIVGSDNFDALVGSPPRGVVFSEWALADPRAWGYIEPILEENGGWAIFPFTPRGPNHGKTMFDHARNTPEWFAQLLTATETDVFSTLQLSNIRAGLISIYGDIEGEALYQQEYNCSFEGCVPGAYFSKQMLEARAQGRVVEVPHSSGYEVDTFWDLGVDDSMTIWFIQPIGKEFRVIDYYENTGYGLEHYAKYLKDKPYAYGNHYMPHDVNVREMTSGDTARSRREVAESLGIRPIQVVKRARSMDVIINVHIPAVRMAIEHCWFDKTKCARGISALEGYRAEYDDDKKKLGNKPLHSWESHGSDAFRTFAVGYTEQLRDISNGQRGGTHIPLRADEWSPMDYL